MALPVLVDSNVIIDIATEDPIWYAWSSAALRDAGDATILVINPIVYAEVSVRYATIETLEVALSNYRRDQLPWEAAFLAGKAFLQYRRRGGSKNAPRPDFYIGAHATVTGMQLLTRDPRRYRTYFPSVAVIAPE